MQLQRYALLVTNSKILKLIFCLSFVFWELKKLPAAAAAAAKSLQSCPTLCDPIDGSPPGSSIHGIFQARVLEWGAIGENSFAIICYWICQNNLYATSFQDSNSVVKLILIILLFWSFIKFIMLWIFFCHVFSIFLD